MIKKHKKHIIRLFNQGVLKVADADWYAKGGWFLDIQDGVVVDIFREDEQ